MTVVDGIKFRSKKEANRYQELKLMERANEITGLRLQPRYPVIIGGVKVTFASGRSLEYVADFEYYDLRTHKVVIEDTKGVKTEGYRIKRALMTAMGKEITEL